MCFTLMKGHNRGHQRWNVTSASLNHHEECTSPCLLPSYTWLTHPHSNPHRVPPSPNTRPSRPNTSQSGMHLLSSPQPLPRTFLLIIHHNTLPATQASGISEEQLSSWGSIAGLRKSVTIPGRRAHRLQNPEESLTQQATPQAEQGQSSESHKSLLSS